MTTSTSSSRRPARIFTHAAILTTGAAIFAATPALAQSTAGFIGARYAEVAVFLEDIDASGIDNGLGVTLRANLPLHRAIDLAVSISQEEIDTNDFRERTAFATLLAHWDAHDLRPYLTGGFGVVEQEAASGGIHYSDDATVATVGGGIEAPIGDSTALDARVTYHKFTDDDLGDYWIYGVSLNHWLNARVGASLGVHFRDSDSILYSLGAALRF